jgi:hypothetical protein
LTSRIDIKYEQMHHVRSASESGCSVAIDNDNEVVKDREAHRKEVPTLLFYYKVRHCVKIRFPGQSHRGSAHRMRSNRQILQIRRHRRRLLSPSPSLRVFGAPHTLFRTALS